jgi:hypothetical protein
MIRRSTRVRLISPTSSHLASLVTVIHRACHSTVHSSSTQLYMYKKHPHNHPYCTTVPQRPKEQPVAIQLRQQSSSLNFERIESRAKQTLLNKGTRQTRKPVVVCHAIAHLRAVRVGAPTTLYISNVSSKALFIILGVLNFRITSEPATGLQQSYLR